MPTSTPWRDRPGANIDTLRSPARPTDECIERLSPVPFQSPRTSYLTPSKRYNSEQPLFGLGLSGSSDFNDQSYITQPDHLYIDQDGGAHVGAKVRSTSKQSRPSERRSRAGRNSEAKSSKSKARQHKNQSHTRSGSTIDDLANIAIATSPIFDNGSPIFQSVHSSTAQNGMRPSTSYIDGHSIDGREYDRPTKRIRSEKLHAMEWSPRDERPRTSHGLQQQSSMEDAKLLLGLRNGYSFSTNTSPVFASVSTLQPLSSDDMLHIPTLSDTQAVPQLEHIGSAQDEGQQEKDKKDHDELVVHDEAQSGTEQINGGSEAVASVQQQQQTEQIIESIDSTAHSKTITDPLDISEKTLAIAEEKILTPPVAPPVKRPRKIKPEIQAEVCAACKKLQRESNGEDTTQQWICCDYCAKWFHLACGGFKDKSETRSVDKFVCKDCEPQHGQTTFVRKSSRVRTAIDYVGLHEGVVKTSAESSLHHYIQPIKDGTIGYQPDSFARVRPELLTAEFWENMDNMKRPFVVPACWNPRFGIPTDVESMKQDSFEAEPVRELSDVMFNEHGKKLEEVPTAHEKHKQLAQGSADELVVDCDQDYLDMVMPRNLTVRRVAELYGPDQPVPVIDVKSQETKGQWTLNEWADYYEQPGDKPIRNVISLEVSNSPIGKLIRRPKAVRDIDLEDNVWDNETRTISNKRPVQFYCLMSVADSYTDFHIDFGGSSVYYHILKGIKTFFFIPPEDKYLKEYEKWCNSDTQNNTWLGDLCNGNVTRVDLHEGDTAFIPAGWIHSVWTPKDSLVIGGNFLTRLDYELQLKVANVEKATKVPQKFRYPFFQKVMWYTLLKYLEEDPVPEEVLRDFHMDEDYRYLRANPIWYELDDVTSDSEPGESGYNAREYPKSEINGLPSLRDYLYRTACIHADIPVPDINKKQIDAVKASIPKGHGDPMRLIKTFAVWCAWKTGNETVPKWVHDQGDGLVSELKEREKAKEETFRVPPERTSARHASKIRGATPGAEVLTTPAKSTNIDSNDTASVKSRSGSRGGSLRIACEACRKRRIKCRHKDGDDNAANSSPPEIRPRTYSNVSVDIPKLPSASPVNSNFDPSLTTNGAASDFNSTSDLAQAALATMNSQSSEPSQGVPTTPNGSSTKKGRSKACEECRKSKRRCVHDDQGRIDPTKAAEPAKPRNSSTNKRHARLSDEQPAKRHKTEFDGDVQFCDVANTSDIDMMIDPALLDDSFSINAIHPPTESIVTHEELSPEMFRSSVPPAAEFEPQFVSTKQEDDAVDTVRPFPRAHPPNNEVQAQLYINVDESMRTGFSTIPAHIRRSPDIDISYSPITVDGNITEPIEKSDVKAEDRDTMIQESRHSAYQSKQSDSKVPDVDVTPSKPGPQNDSDHRGSSSSAHTVGTTVKSRRSSSNTSGTTHRLAAVNANRRQSGEPAARRMSRASSADSDISADERFARELQAAENGLRRRASMRA